MLSSGPPKAAAANLSSGPPKAAAANIRQSGAAARGAAHEKRAELGRAAEHAVVEWLIAHGFEIVATNLRLGQLELDVVARQGPLIAVVEVRARGPGAWTRPFGSVDGAKRRRLQRAGERLWQRRYRSDPSADRLRFDVASVTFAPSGVHVEYVPAAF